MGFEEKKKMEKMKMNLPFEFQLELLMNLILRRNEMIRDFKFPLWSPLLLKEIREVNERS